MKTIKKQALKEGITSHCNETNENHTHVAWLPLYIPGIDKESQSKVQTTQSNLSDWSRPWVMTVPYE